MPQTRMFRDRVVSMEQTLEGGEKNLELLKGLCRDALPEFTYKEHALDHERDLFVMVLEAPDGRTKRVSWTRMVLFDAERIPVLNGDPLSALRTKIVEFLRGRASRPEIVVTFRHLEDGWIDTPEPRREKRRRRGRGDRGRRDGRREQAPPERERGAGQPGRPAQPQHDRRPFAGPAPQAQGQPRGQAQAQGHPQGQGPGPEGQRPGGGRRRRRFRRRRGRGSGGSAPSGSGVPPSGAP